MLPSNAGSAVFQSAGLLLSSIQAVWLCRVLRETMVPSGLSNVAPGGPAAIQYHGLPDHEAGALGSEEERDLRHLLDAAEPSLGRAALQAGDVEPPALHQSLHKGRADIARRNSVDTYPTSGPLDAECPRQHDHARLADAVGQPFRRSYKTIHRGNVEDYAPALRQHASASGLSTKKASGQIDIERQAPKIGRHTSELQSRGHLVCRLLLEQKTPLA